MNVSAALNVLKHAPAQYPFLVEQGGHAHEVLALEYSHEPARAVVKIAEAIIHEDASPEELAKIQAVYWRWWNNEGSEMQRQGDEDIAEFVARATRIAWMNGAYVRRYVAEFELPVAPLPEPEATIAELNAMPIPVLNEVLDTTGIGAIENAPADWSLANQRAQDCPFAEPVPVVPERVEPMGAAEVAEAMQTMAVDPYAQSGVTSQVTADESGVTVATAIGEAQSDEVAEIAIGKGVSGDDIVKIPAKRTRKPKAAPAPESAPATPTE